MLLGLTDGYCAGKNAVASILEAQGWTCIDVDTLGHEAMLLAKQAIVERFGAAVLGADGELDRRAIARIVFSDPAALADQEAIVHPIAVRLTDERIAAAEAAARAAGRGARVCINAALLYRMDQAKACDAIIEVRAPLLARLRRARARDGIGAAQALTRIRRQKNFWALREKAGRPVVCLRNGRGREELAAALELALREVFARSSTQER